MSSGNHADPARPVHLRPGLIGLVLLGGALGTAAREALSLVLPSFGTVPVAVVAVNLAGSFALGLLLERLVDAGSGRARNLRLFTGTGFLGGFTTYSALAAGTDSLLRAGDVPAGTLYAAGTLLLGLAAAGAGVAVAGSGRRRAHPASTS